MKNLFYFGTWAFLAALAGCGKPAPGPYVDKAVAQQVTCLNNLKQISLGLYLWAGDHGNKYPFDVSTNVGGMKELVIVKGSQRQNGYLIFQCASNELHNPLVVVCPEDTTMHAAKDWSSLSESNVTYAFPVSTNIKIVCPVDGNALYLDGSVIEGKTGKRWH